MTNLINAFLLVVVGEIGDKTQLLVMGLASRYSAAQVMLGVLIATLLNHGLAVLIGSALGSVLPMTLISILAGVSFLVFGLWILRGDDDDEHVKTGSFGPVLTVALAFFLAEMGDKTQLMAVAISAEYKTPFLILTGTTLGMLAASGLGVFCGAWICRHLSQAYIKWVAGLVFIFFGSLNLYKNLPPAYLTPLNGALYGIGLGMLIYLAGVRFAHRTPDFCAAVEGEEPPGFRLPENPEAPSK